MLASAVIVFREAFEAFLIIGAMLISLGKLNDSRSSKYVLWGSAAGFFLSLLSGFLLFSTILQLESYIKNYFQAGALIFVSLLIAYFIIWVNTINKKKESKLINSYDVSQNSFTLFFIPFLSVFREGLEVVIFLLPELSQGVTNIALGGSIGIVLAIFLAYIIFKSTYKLNMSLLFSLLNLTFILMGAMFFGEGLAILIPLGASVETAGKLIYGIPGLYFFLRSDIKSYLNKFKKTP